MNISNYKKAHILDVKKWLEEELELTAYQKEKLYDSQYGNGILQNTSFSFFKWQPQKSKNVFWRLTAIFVLPYMLLLFIGMPIKYLFTGNSYYGKKFINKFHTPWMTNCGLNHFI